MKIVIAGSSGFIGSNLVRFFKQKDFEIIELSRHPEKEQHFWDPNAGKIDASILENSDVVINLCGESIVGRFTEKKMQRLRTSRFLPTQFLTSTILKLKNKPKVYIGASAIGYYGDRNDEILTESSSSGEGFLAEVCKYWEIIPRSLESENIRVVLARFGVVLGKEGGMLKKMKLPFSLGLGGKLGDGKQKMSWIAIDDLTNAMEHLIAHSEISGPVNFTSPEAVSNKKFTKILGSVLHRPTFMTVPRWVICTALLSGAQVLLASQRVYPEKLLQNSYKFIYQKIEEALKTYL